MNSLIGGFMGKVISILDKLQQTQEAEKALHIINKECRQIDEELKILDKSSLYTKEEIEIFKLKFDENGDDFF
jgi:hypothetical protein